MFIISPSAFPGSMYTTLLNLGITSGLQLCLDAGDAESYDGSSQTWVDRSGNGYNFYRGSGSGSDGADPTFNGSAGQCSSGEYFSFDGGDCFTLASANPTWVNNIHKANAQFTLASWTYLNGITSGGNWGETGTALAADGWVRNGFQFDGSISSLRALTLYVTKETPYTVVYDKTTIATGNNNTWNFLAVSVDIVAGTVIFVINETAETYTGQVYTSPATGNAYSTLQIGNVGGNSPLGFEKSGCRRAVQLGWSGAKSATDLISIFSASRTRFGV